MIHILSSNGFHRIESLKEQTENETIKSFQPDKVYIPAVDNKGLPLDKEIAIPSSVSIGTLLGIRKDFGVPIYSSVSGKVIGKAKKFNGALGRLSDFFEIENNKKNERVTLAPLAIDATQADLVNKLKEGGIVGLGGAGFPAFIKYNIKPEMKIDHIIINACECEPYLTTDYNVGIKSELAYMLKALKTIMDILAIPSTIIATKNEKTALIEKISKDIEAFGDNRISMQGVKSVYPAGYERTLIKFLLKRDYIKLPSEAHVIVSNLQTMIAIGDLFAEGKTISDKVITVSGCVKNPANVSIPYGTLIKDIISFVGGYTIEKGVLLNGGPMTCEHLGTDDVPLLIQNDAITVLKEKNLVAEPCLRCGKCTAHCPVNIQPVEINMAAKRGDYQRCFELGVMDCVLCGICSYVCPSHIEVSAGVKQAKLMTMFKVAKKK